jgi:hypothetical protein
MNYKIL